MSKICIVSMSGGLDSTTLAAKALNDGYTILPVNFNYGQKNIIETQAFKNIYKFFQDKYPGKILPVVEVDLSSILDSSLKLYQTIRDSGTVAAKTDMEFYTPSRNMVFTTISAMLGEIAAFAGEYTSIEIGLGVHKHTIYDRDYWDISPEFVHRMNEVFKLNDCLDVKMYAPYANTTKSDIVKDAIKFELPYNQTWTCYDPETEDIGQGITKYSPCGKCEACIERQKAGDDAGVNDINDYSILVNSLNEIYKG